MARRRQQLYGEEIINLGSEISQMAKGSSELEQSIQKAFRSGRKLSTTLEKDLKKMYGSMLKKGRDLDKQIQDLINSQAHLTKEGQNRLKVLSAEKKATQEKSTSLERLLGQQQQEVDTLELVMRGTKKLAVEVIALTIVYGTLRAAIAAVTHAYDNWFELQSKLQAGMANIAMSTGATADQFDDMRGMVETMAPSLGELTSEIDGLRVSSEYVRDLAVAFRDIRNLTPDLAQSLVKVGRGFGIGADGATELYRLISTGAEDPQARFEQFAADMVRFGDQIGAMPGVLMQDYREAQDAIAQFGDVGERTFRDAAMMANRFGFETRKIFEMVRGFDTFQQASQNVNQLNAMFGTAISSFELMMEQDPSRRLEMVRGAIMGMGLEWGNMNRIQHMQLAQTLNMSEAELSRVFTENMTLQDLENERLEREREQLKNQEMQAENTEMINRLLGRTDEIFESWSRRIEAIWNTISRNLSPIFEVVHEIIQDIGREFEAWTKDLGESEEFQATIREIAMDIRDFVGDIGTKIKEIDWSNFKEDASDVWQAIVKISDAISEMIDFFKDNEDVIMTTLVSSFRIMSGVIEVASMALEGFMHTIRSLVGIWNQVPQPIRQVLGGRILGNIGSQTAGENVEIAREGLGGVSEQEETAISTGNLEESIRGGLSESQQERFSNLSPTERIKAVAQMRKGRFVEPDQTSAAASPRTERTAQASETENAPGGSPVVAEITIPVEMDGERVGRAVARVTVNKSVSNRAQG